MINTLIFLVWIISPLTNHRIHNKILLLELRQQCYLGIYTTNMCSSSANKESFGYFAYTIWYQISLIKLNCIRI